MEDHGFTIPEGHELISFSGVKLIQQAPKTVLTWWYGTKEIPQPPIAKHITETTFPAYDLPNYDSYRAEFRGEFELLGVYLYTTSSDYAHGNKTWPVTLCMLLDRTSEVWAATKLQFLVEQNVALPIMRRYETYTKESGKNARLTELRASLVFPSREVLVQMTKSLEPGDSVTIAKLQGIV
jgi:hypothetical protein